MGTAPLTFRCAGRDLVRHVGHPRHQDEQTERGIPMATDPQRALSTGSPALAALMLSLGRLVLGRLVLGSVRRGDRPVRRP